MAHMHYTGRDGQFAEHTVQRAPLAHIAVLFIVHSAVGAAAALVLACDRAKLAL